MYLLYLDASGTPELQDPNSKHYVLIGLCMHEGSWFALDRRIHTLKRKYCCPSKDPDLLEIHVKQFAVTIREQDLIPGFEQMSRIDRRTRVLEIRQQKIEAETTPEKKRERREKYKETDPFIHLTRSERSQLLEDSIDIISGHDQIKLFGEAVSKTHPAVTSRSIDPVSQAFTQVVSRFDKFLQKKDSWKREGNPRRKIDHGLLMLDQDASTESTIERLFKRFREHGHPFGEMTHVIDVPFFASSAKVGGLQLADVAAYVVRRYIDRDAVAGSHEERHFMKLFQRFDRDTYGNLHGLRHYVPANSCACMVCRDRGHGKLTLAQSTS